MKLINQKPQPELLPYIKRYWYIEVEPTDIPLSQLSFSYGSHESICYLETPNYFQWINDQNTQREPELFYAGQFTKPFLMHFDGPCRIVGASFYPWAGNTLFAQEAKEFTNQMIPLDLLGVDEKLYCSIKESPDCKFMFSQLEDFIKSQINLVHYDHLVGDIAKNVLSNTSREGANAIIDKTGLSRRRIEQRFIAATGLTLGMFTRKIRFQQAVQILNQKKDECLTQIGLEAGYYDQSHFISEFKEFAGCTPRAFLKRDDMLKTMLSSLVVV